MKQIEDMLEQRKEDKDLCRETTLYNMCDNMLSDLDQLQKGIMVVNSQHDTTVSEPTRLVKAKSTANTSFNHFT